MQNSVSSVVDITQLIICQAYEFGSIVLILVGGYKNRKFGENMVQAEENFDPVMHDMLFDSQTPCGLLIGCAEKDAAVLVQRLHDEGAGEAAVIGTVEEDAKRKIQLT